MKMVLRLRRITSHVRVNAKQSGKVRWKQSKHSNNFSGRSRENLEGRQCSNIEFHVLSVDDGDAAQISPVDTSLTQQDIHLGTRMENAENVVQFL
jgi:hypothetical protein